MVQRLGARRPRLRVDRLLAEVHAGGGDPVTLTQLFGISDRPPSAFRYCGELDLLGQEIDRDPGS
jgi:hypothetical protein